MKKFLFATLIILLPGFLFAQNDTTKTAAPKPTANEAAELAKKLANPIASLISVPLQNNTYYGIGKFNGTQNVLNFQPVIPVKLTANWNVITRVILPIVTQYNVTGANTKQSGLSDITASAFLSPSKTHNGVTWGVGPAFLVPTATDTYLGTGKWGAGPTAVILKQTHGFTYGALANQIWSFAGQSDRSEVNQLFVQPFVTYNWKSGAGIGVVGYITQNWLTGQTTSYIVAPLTGITKLGKQIIQLGVGPQVSLSGPQQFDFGWRAQLVFIFPK